MCEKLNCTPNDLLSWMPDADTPLPDTHSLTKLKRDKTAFQLQETLKTMSLEELKEVSEHIKQKKKEKE